MKFYHDRKNAELPQTSAAIAGLSDALARLNSAIGSKKDELARKERGTVPN